MQLKHNSFVNRISNVVFIITLIVFNSICLKCFSMEESSTNKKVESVSIAVNNMENEVIKACEYIRTKTDIKPEIAIILGSGLGGYADSIDNRVSIPYSEIPYFPTCTAPGHTGNLVLGEKSNKKVVIMQGRIHYYEGYSMNRIAFPIKVLKALGVKDLIVTNASGGLNETFKVGDLMIIDSHINFMGSNPLIGPNDDKSGDRFFSVQNIYNTSIIEEAEKLGEKIGISMKRGTYIAVTGPNYETNAEIKAFRILGGDAVGMSTVPEILVAAHCGINRVLGLSFITNTLTTDSQTEIDYEEVIRIANSKIPLLNQLLDKVISKF